MFVHLNKHQELTHPPFGPFVSRAMLLVLVTLMTLGATTGVRTRSNTLRGVYSEPSHARRLVFENGEVRTAFFVLEAESDIAQWLDEAIEDGQNEFLEESLNALTPHDEQAELEVLEITRADVGDYWRYVVTYKYEARQVDDGQDPGTPHPAGQIPDLTGQVADPTPAADPTAAPVTDTVRPVEDASGPADGTAGPAAVEVTAESVDAEPVDVTADAAKPIADTVEQLPDTVEQPPDTVAQLPDSVEQDGTDVVEQDNTDSQDDQGSAAEKEQDSSGQNDRVENEEALKKSI